MWFWLFWICFAVTILMVFYIRWLLKNIESMSEETKSISIMISDFASHAKSVYELEMFYGDDTLNALLNHAREIVKNIDAIDFILDEEDELAAEEETSQTNEE